MDLFLTLIIILAIVFWPKHGRIRYYLLFSAGILMLVIALLFAPVLLLSPLFYIGMAISAALMIYKVITKERNEGEKK